MKFYLLNDGETLINLDNVLAIAPAKNILGDGLLDDFVICHVGQDPTKELRTVISRDQAMEIFDKIKRADGLIYHDQEFRGA